MRPKIYLPVIIGLAIIVAIVGIWISTIKEKEPKVYKIGAILPLTGNLAILGEPEKNGMSLAEEIINQQGGINGRPIKIIFEDSKGQPKEAVSIANKFINIDGIKIICIYHWSKQSNSTYSSYQESYITCRLYGSNDSK
jgi:branched-chain amino acid transport system substrate-binding protein